MPILSVLALAVALPLSPPDPAGMWRTPRGGVVQVERCGAALCGRIVSVPAIPGNPQALDWKNKDAAQRKRPLKGVAVLSGFTGGPAKWASGRIYNPEDGGSYSGSIDASDPAVLKVKGCIAAFLCRTQNWMRLR